MMEEFKDLMSTSVFKRKLSVVGTPRQSDLGSQGPSAGGAPPADVSWSHGLTLKETQRLCVFPPQSSPWTA